MYIVLKNRFFKLKKIPILIYMNNITQKLENINLKEKTKENKKCSRCGGKHFDLSCIYN